MSTVWGPTPGRVDRTISEADFEEFKRICTCSSNGVVNSRLTILGSQQIEAADYPLASEIQKNIPIYSARALTEVVRGSPDERETVMVELHQALSVGPGVFVVKGLLDKSTVDKAVEIVSELEKQEQKAPSEWSDRTFAFGQKHALHDPISYAEYYGSDLLQVPSLSRMAISNLLEQ